MKKICKRMIAIFLALAGMLSLCSCAQNPQTGTQENKWKISAQREALLNRTAPKISGKQSETSDVQPAQGGFSTEAQQSLVWLRKRINFPQTMFGMAYLGYTGEASEGDWLSEANQSMLAEYPFLSEIDAGHTVVGNDDYLYCLVPLDENASVSINLVRWDPKSNYEEVLEVLYRSESGDPVLIFAACGDDAYAYLSYVQVQIVDSAGNSCVWYPQLDAMGHIVPCHSESGDEVSFDFTEYGWLQAPEELAPWLSSGYSGVYAPGLAGCWITQGAAWDTDRTANYYLWFFPEDENGGTVNLDWQYEGSDLFEEMWSGFWTIESVMDGPNYVSIELSLVGGENYGVTEGPYYISETYPLVISPSGEEMVIGTGFNGIRLPFIPQYDPQPCTLVLDSWFTESPDW